MIILSHTVHADDFVAKTIFNTETNWNKKQFLYPYFFKPIVILKIKVIFAAIFHFLEIILVENLHILSGIQNTLLTFSKPFCIHACT
jgi:hypothetical protein